jgi:serine/threonine protein kinase
MPGQGQGRLLGNRYRLSTELGHGGMGTVWRARDELLDREVAIKEVLLPPGLSAEETDVLYQRTFREARASARLNHPGVVTVHDVISEGKRPWIVMELVVARSLQEILDESGPLPVRRVADIGRQVLGALVHAHKAGILHRDVKPSNILITDDDRAVLTDFGIAQVEGDATLTQTGLVMGSPAYIPPERVQGQRAVPASDVWALGATLYTCLEGKAPYERTDAMAALAAALHEPVPSPVKSGPLRPILEGMLERDPAERTTAAAAIPMLAKVATAEPQPQPVPTVVDKPGPAPDPDTARTVLDPLSLQVISPPVRAMPVTGAHDETLVVSGNDARPPALPRHQQQPSPQYSPHAYTAPSQPQPAPEGRRTRTVVIILVTAVIVAVALVAGALILHGRSSRNNGNSGGNSGNSGDPNYTVQTGSGFSVSVPKGWTPQPLSRKVSYWSPDQSMLMQVDQTKWDNGTALAQAQYADAHAAKNSAFPRYAVVGTGPVGTTFQGQKAAVWEFTFTDPARGVTEHAKDEWFELSGHSFAIYVRTPQSNWNTVGEPAFARALATIKSVA